MADVFCWKPRPRLWETTLKLPIIESCIQNNGVWGKERKSPCSSEGISMTCAQRQYYREIIAKIRILYLFTELVTGKTGHHYRWGTQAHLRNIPTSDRGKKDAFIHSFRTFTEDLQHVRQSTKWWMRITLNHLSVMLSRSLTLQWGHFLPLSMSKLFLCF